MNKKYTDEQVQLCIKLCLEHKYSGKEIADLVNEKYGCSMKACTVHDILNRRGYKLDNQKVFTEEMGDYLRAIVEGRCTKEIAEMVNEKFGTHVTDKQVRSYKQARKIVSGYNAQFPKGHVPWSKGKPCCSEPFKNQQFKKGHRPDNYQPVGTVTRRASMKKLDGREDVCWYIKIAEPNKWQLYNRYVWEQATGEKLKNDEFIIFLDGNVDNNDISNLMKIDRSIHGVLNQRGLRYDDPEATKCGVTIAQIMKRKNEIKKGKKRNDEQ